MISALLFLDAGFPGGGVIGAVLGVALFLFLGGVALIAYLSLRKTLKWAFRIAIVIGLLMVGLVGCIALWWYGSSTDKPRPRPPVSRPR